jgi:hypothetical protein
MPFVISRSSSLSPLPCTHRLDRSDVNPSIRYLSFATSQARIVPSSDADKNWGLFPSIASRAVMGPSCPLRSTQAKSVRYSFLAVAISFHASLTFENVGLLWQSLRGKSGPVLHFHGWTSQNLPNNLMQVSSGRDKRPFNICDLQCLHDNIPLFDQTTGSTSY